MISTQLVVLLLAVAGLAFYAGFLFGRQSVASSGTSARTREDDPGEEPAPGPARNPLPGPRPFEPDRPRAAPPPAQAGNAGRQANANPSESSGVNNPGALPRRSSTPPPARAGLLDAGKPKK